MTRPPSPTRNPANTKETTHISRRKTPSGTRRLLNIGSLSADGEQAAIRSDVPAAVDERWRSERRLADVVRAKQLERRTCAQHERFALIVGKENLPVGRNRRCRKALALRDAQPSLPQHLPRHRLERGDDARHVVHHVKLVAIHDWRRHERRPFRAGPRQVRSRHIAAASGTNRQRRAYTSR